MALENDTEAPLLKRHQNSIERQVETLKRGLRETGLTDLPMDREAPPKKIGHLSCQMTLVAVANSLRISRL